MTISAPIDRGAVATVAKVYLPQQDSHLLVRTMERTLAVRGRRVLDLCTGTGVVAIAAANAGARSVDAWDVSRDAAACATANALAAGVRVGVRHGSWTEARGPYDVVLANPPYVPADPTSTTPCAGPTWAWDAGPEGRLVVDPLCAAAPDLLARGGSLLFVQSEFTGLAASLATLTSVGLKAKVVARQRIPFGPVLESRAEWLERTGRLPVGRRYEEIHVIRADKP